MADKIKNIQFIHIFFQRKNFILSSYFWEYCELLKYLTNGVYCLVFLHLMMILEKNILILIY